MNLDTDTVLYQQDADKKIYPASITKVMTALLVLDAVDSGKLSLDQKLTAGPSLWQGIEADTSTADIKTGEKLTVQELLNCLLIASAGEAANVLAVGVSGSIEAFVKDMNKKAADIGCVGTHFCNPAACRTRITTPPATTSIRWPRRLWSTRSSARSWPSPTAKSARPT